MALHQNDELAKIIGTTISSIRFDALVFALVSTEVNGLNQNLKTHYPDRENIAAILKTNPMAAQALRNMVNTTLIEEDQLLWLTDSKRQLNWIYNQIPSGLMRPSTPENLNAKQKSIAVIDHLIAIHEYRTKIKNGIHIVKNLAKNWETQKKTDKHFEWIKPELSDEKVEHVWVWINNKFPQKFDYSSKFLNYDQLMTFMDYQSMEFRELTGTNSRKTWNQKISRQQRTDKKQFNLLLPVGTLLKLEKIATENGISKTEAIEILINSESKNKIYIAKKLAAINSLKDG